MYLLYIDESGISAIPGNSTHFVLAGISVPIWHWRDCERAIYEIKRNYQLENAEIHTGWILRKYLEQSRIENFSSMDYSHRRSEVIRKRTEELYRLQHISNPRHNKQTKKNFDKTEPYIHLTYEERKRFMEEIAICVSGWGFARLFAECIDKIHFDPTRTQQTIDEQAFDQIVSRFEQFLENISTPDKKYYGLLIHDNNLTVEKRHIELMKKFQHKGTLWTEVQHIVENPFFVDSELTILVQIADLCSYALRRYLENQEDFLFKHIFQRADRKGSKVVGVRHFTDNNCSCMICRNHSADL